MEDLDDDFGELYADVEVQVSAAINAIPSFNQVNGESENKSEDSDHIEAIRSDSTSMEAHDYSDDGRANQENTKAIVTDSKTLNGGSECEKGLILDNGSDSEDDLNIVLNEEDCPPSRNPYDLNARNVGIGSDEEDDLVIVTEANTSSKDRKLADQQQMLSDGLERSSVIGVERGNGTKARYHTQYSQYKYIRSYGATYQSNNKMNGSGPAVGRGDWDVNGSNQPLRSSLGPAASSGNASFLMAAQSGCEFSLPRNRTIFDVNIESIGQKPWRLPGVDISEFFNFGLDEESWKQYCNCLEQFRQQGSAVTKLRSYQAYEAECREENVAEEIAQMQQGDRVSPVIENADRRRLELPKGRAIQVEGGIGERRPSMDVRRPRVRDSDAVIQISVQESTETSLNSSKEEPGYTNDSENDGSLMDLDQSAQPARFDDEHSRKFDVSYIKDSGLCPLARCSRSEDASSALSLDPENQGSKQVFDGVFNHEKKKEHACEESSKTMEMVNDTKEEADKNLSRSGRYKLEAESSLGDRIQHTSSLSYSDSHSMSYKAGVDSDKETTCNPAKRTSSDSVNGLRESSTPNSCHSKSTRSNDSKTEPGDRKNDFFNQNPMQEKNHCTRLRLRSVAEVKIHAIDDGTITRSNGKGCYDENHVTQRHVKHREWNVDFYDTDKNSYCRDSEMSIDHQSGRFTKRHVRNAYNDFFCERRPLRVEMDAYPRRRPWHEREYPLEERSCRDIKVKQNKQNKYGLNKKGYSDEELRAASHVESTWFTSESYVYSDEEDRNSWQPRRNGEDLFERKDDDFVLEHRYREEFVKIDYRRSVPYRGRERECFREKSNRRARPHGQEMKGMNRRDRYWDDPHPDLLNDSYRSTLPNDEYCGHYNFETLPPNSYRESPLSNGRGWQDSTSLKNDAYCSRRIDKKDVDHWRQTHSLKQRNNSFFDHGHRDDPIADYLDDERRYFGQSMTFDWPRDKLRSRSRGRVDAKESFSPYGSSKRKSVHVKHGTSHVGLPFDDEQLERDRKRLMREESKYSQVSNRSSFNFGMIETNEPANLRCRDSIEQHLIDWKGKSSRRLSKAGNARCSRNEKINHSVDEERITFRHSDESYLWNDVPSKGESISLHHIRSKVERVGKCDRNHFSDQNNGMSIDKSRVNKQDETVLEEGQLAIEPERETCGHPETNLFSVKTSQAGVAKEEKANSDNASENKIGGVDSNRILETLAKMERRRERFKEPIALKKEPDKNLTIQVDTVETTEAKQQRPARKRRWGGS